MYSLDARVRVLERNQIESRRPPDAAHANLQSAAEMVSRDAIDASGGDLASPASDIAISFENQGSVTDSKVLSLSPDITYKLRLVPFEAPSFMQPAVCVLEEGLLSPLWIGCPRDKSYPRVAYGERIEYCHAELYAIPGPRFFVRDPTGKSVRLNGRSLSSADVSSDLHEVKDGDIIHLNIRYSDRLGITHPATGLKIELLSAPHSNSVQCPDALHRCDSSSNTANSSTLVQFTDLFDPPSFTAVLCQLIDGARPVSLRRSHAENTSSVIIFDSMTVSRRHAAVWCEQSQVFIVDRHSTHGTFLNGHKLLQDGTLSSAEVLVDGDILRIGAVDERAAIRGITVKLSVRRIPE
ncbi:hypothetical protein DFH09DRAFT_1174233 [Mycena vulgaris]|nr:hypothetical protein DFH09DRAFT_1174233 [Mycena vulgaris]